MDVNLEQLVYNEVTILIPLILAIAVHEWAHVAMARFLGDSTGTSLGRFTLNPLAHIDPVWTLLVPAVFVYLQSGGLAVPFFGAGKPAPYNPVRLDRKINGKRISMRTGTLLVALAGPLSNVALFAVSAVVMVVLVKAGFSLADAHSPALLLLRFALLNAGLAVFNLVPIPPLDGSKVLMGLLPRDAAAKYERVAAQLSWVFLLLLFAGGARLVFGPVQNAVAQFLFSLAT